MPFVLQCMVSLANHLPVVWEDKINMPYMYSLFILYIFKDMLITYINVSDLRPIIQSAILLICKSGTKVPYGVRTNCHLPCLQTY